MATDFSVPSPEALDDLFRTLSNWDRFGPDDQRGTLNYLTPARVAAAAGLVVTGETISLAHDLATEPMPEHPHPVQHHMLASGDARVSNGIPGYEAARDHLALDVHGLWTTHVDALSHMFVRGQMYNARSASLVQDDGAAANSVMSMADGIAGRGILLDIPASRGTAYLEEDDVVTIEDLERAEAFGDVSISKGDLVLISTGRDPLRRARGSSFSGLASGMAGLDPECLEWLAEREPAVLGSDGISDRLPFQADPSWPFPIHQIAITAMGLHLIDAMDLEALSARCLEWSRWTFMVVVSILRIPGGTASPVNPIAIF